MYYSTLNGEINLFHRVRLFVCILIVMSTLTSCSFKSVSLHHQADVDFNQLTTYALFDRDSVFSDQQIINNNLRNGIELAIENSFEKHGFSYQDINSADVIVAYALTGLPVLNPFNYTNNKVKCDFCRNDKKEKKSQYRSERQKSQQLYKADNKRDVGALVIDILDKETFRTLFEGEYPLKIKKKHGSQEVQKKIQEAVDEIMLYYSKKALKS